MLAPFSYMKSTDTFAFGNALQFDRVNDFVNFTTIGFALSNEWSISFWMKNNSFNHVVFSNTKSANQLIYVINSTLIRVQFNGGSAVLSRLNFTVPTMSTSTWYHVFITKDNLNDVRLYLNSVESSTGALPTNDFMNFTQMSGYSGLFYDGALDEVAFWQTTGGTSQNAIDLYNSGNGALASDVIASPTAYWRCNEADGATTLADETGNYNGTLNNFSTPPAYFIPH